MSFRSGWYTIAEGQKTFPRGHGPCTLCRRALKPFDVLYVKRVSVPKGNYSRNNWSQDYYVLMHKVCLVNLIDKAPPDVLNVYDEIRDRVLSGGGLFDG